VRELEEGSVDLLICYTQPELPLHLDPQRYLSLHLADDALVPYCKPDAQGQPLHPLLGAATGPVAQLRYGEGTFLARATALAVHRSDLAMRLHPVVESALAEALRACALAGMGVAWLPRSLVVDDLERGVLVRAGGPEHELVLQTRLYGERSLVQGRLKGLWRAAGALANAGVA
jgi:DNA-binding transcriptional LysR family regulator